MVGRSVAGLYRGVTLVTLLATFFLIVIGAVVRVSGSGLGCPDWPTCHGNWIPPLQLEALIEYSHRLSASLVSLCVVLTLVGALAFFRRRPVIWSLAVAVFGLLIVQIMLGAITVRLELPEDIVTVHLGTALAIFGVLVVLNLAFVRPRGARRLADSPADPADRRDPLFWWATITAGAIYLVMLSGAYVRGHGAASACGRDWPLCLGSPFATGEMAAVHVGHRYLVALVSVLVVVVVVQAWRRRSRLPALGQAALTLGFVFVVQILVGAANPWTKLAPAAQAAHLAVATLVWGAAIALAVLTWWLSPAPAKQPAVEPLTVAPAPQHRLSKTPGS